MTRIQSVFNQLKRLGFALLLLGWGVEPIHAAWERIHTFDEPLPYKVKYQTPDVAWALTWLDTVLLSMSVDGGYCWVNIENYPIDTGPEDITILDSLHIAGHDYMNIVTSSNRGADWHTGTIDVPSEITCIAFADTQIMFAGDFDTDIHAPYVYNTILRSTDGGDTWNPVDVLAGDWGRYERIACSTSGTVLALLSERAMVRSRDRGDTWHRHFPSPISQAIGLASPDSAVFLIAGELGGHPVVARSTNDGLDWTIVWSDTASSNWFRDLAVNVPGLVWIVGTDGRTLASRDGGLSWNYNQTDSSETDFENATIISSTLGYAYDDSNGVIWRWNGEFVSANSPPVPTEFSFSAYPNPFNSTLNISLSLPLYQEVKITLYDLLGREVDMIHRGRLDNTTLSYTTPPTLASGIYFLRAATTSQTQMQKVVLLK